MEKEKRRDSSMEKKEGRDSRSAVRTKRLNRDLILGWA